MKQYDEEFKKMIVGFAKAGNSRKQLAEEYNISTASIHNWRKVYGSSLTQEVKDRNSYDRELRILQKELAQVKEENEVLKSA